MAQSSNGEAPNIIIKKIKKIEGGHHGGAWKVAYADFVTAMMAFFLMLWLLSTTTKEQRDGLSEYFTLAQSTSATGGGDGLLGGQSVTQTKSISEARQRLPCPWPRPRRRQRRKQKMKTLALPYTPR